MEDNKSLYLAALIISVVITGSQFNFHEFIELERYQHTLVSLFIILFVSFSFGSELIYIFPVGVVTLIAGFLKEMTDPHIDVLDIFANGYGVAIGVMIIMAYSLIKPRELHRGHVYSRYRG